MGSVANAAGLGLEGNSVKNVALSPVLWGGVFVLSGCFFLAALPSTGKLNCAYSRVRRRASAFAIVNQEALRSLTGSR